MGFSREAVEDSISLGYYNRDELAAFLIRGGKIQKAGFEPELPEMLGGYNKIKEIGRGAFASIYSVKHLPTDKLVAIKVIFKRLSEDKGVKLHREPDNMKWHDHPNIVKLLQIIDTEKYLYLAMEFVPGGDLCHYLYELKNVKKKTMSEKEARNIFRQMVSAVLYLHERNIIHRDLNPYNFLMDESKENIKLADFGLSTIGGTGTSTLCGSPSYIAPEVLQKTIYNGFKSDVWSLGIILHEMVDGSLPFEGDTFDDELKCIENGYTVPQHLSDECKELLLRIIEVHPIKRISLKEVMEHKWMNIGEKVKLKPHTPANLSDQKQIKELMIKKGYKQEDIKKSLENPDYSNDVQAAYLILGGNFPKANVPAITVTSIPIRPGGAKKPNQHKS